MAAEYELNIKFVQEIENYPCLYNFRLPEYIRRDTTEKAWREIGKKFRLTGPECKEKWKNLRSVFVRHLKPPKGEISTTQKKPYYLADYMQFALPFIKKTGKISEKSQEIYLKNEHVSLLPQSQSIFLPEESSALQSQSLSPQTGAEIIPSTSSQSILQPQPSTPRSQSRQSLEHKLYSDTVPTVSESEIQPLLKKKKIQRSNYEELRIEQDISAYLKLKQAKMNENNDNADSSNKMFLLSVLTDMNKMNDKQRRTFKRRMLELVDEIMDQD